MRDKIDSKLKIRATITLDSDLLEKLESYKIKNNIKKLSPMLNEMLWEWINKEEKRNK